MLTVVGYPVIAPVSILLGVPSRLISVPFRATVLALTLIILVRRLLVSPRLSIGPFWIMWWAWWGMYLARFLADKVGAPENLRLPLSEYLIYAIGTSILPALAVAIESDGARTARTLKGIVLVGAGAIVVNVWLIARLGGLVGIGLFFAARPETNTLNPVSFGHLGATVFMLSAWHLVTEQAESPGWKAVLTVTLMIGSTATLMSGSRAPFLVLVASIPLLMYVAAIHGRKGSLTWIGLTIAFLVGGFVWLSSRVETFYAVARIREGEEVDLMLNMLRDGWRLFLNAPLVGAGIEPLGVYTHNAILDSLIMFGIFSGALFVLLLASASRSSLGLIRRGGEGGWLALLFIQAGLASMVAGALFDNAFLWITTALVVTVASRTVGRERDATPGRPVPVLPT